MANWLKYVIALASALALMLLFRTLAFSIHTVGGDGLAPLYHDGDQLLINRFCYGLRIEGNGLLPYSRLWRQPVRRGDIVVIDVSDGPAAGIHIARCTGLPGDTLRTNRGTLTVPGLAACADADYYWVEAVTSLNPVDSRHLGFIHERHIMGRVATVLYNRQQLLTSISQHLTPTTYHLSPNTQRP